MVEIPHEIDSTYELDGETWALVGELWGNSAHRFWAKLSNPSQTMSVAEFEKRATSQWYPESEKLAAARVQRNTVTEFLEWLTEVKGYTLAKWSEPDAGFEQDLFPVYDSFDRLAMQFLGVNEGELEAERRAMLKSLREANGDA